MGRYELSWEAEGSTLVATRRLTTTVRSVPPERYAALRAFLAEVFAAEASAALVHVAP